jgi:MFS transporter, DHA2 family, multidrug resistance protein
VPRFASQAREGLIEHVTPYDPPAAQRLAGLKSYLVGHGTPAGLAEAKAIGIMNGQAMRQATMLSFERIFMLFGMAFLLALPLLVMMKWKRPPVAVPIDAP